MKYLFYFICLMTTLIGCSLNPQEIPAHFEMGVSKDLADLRKNAISNIEYVLDLKIPSNQNEEITGQIQINFKAENQEQIVIDFQEESNHILSVAYNEIVSDYTFHNHHIIIPAKINNSEHEVVISFVAGNLSLNRNEEFLYTLFVPDRASTAIPLFDQPNLKGTYQLNLTIPKDWEAIANGKLLSNTIDDTEKHLIFQKTAPISTYLLAFAAGKFQTHFEVVGQDTFEFLYRENDPEKIKRNIPEIMQLHVDARNWLEEYTGIPYPFRKYGWATIPPFQYGGMEHPGAIFYRERSLFLDESATASQKLGRASLIAHEVAHMWFGDLVTMDWFDDVWLKEVFANFMAAKIVQPNFPEINHDVRFLLSHFPSAYSVDRTDGANPVLQPLDNLKDAGSVYGDIIYHKAPIVMQMLENKIGPEAMQAGLRSYLNKYAFGNAIWDDLISILDQDGALRQWSDVWVKEAGMPRIDITKDDDFISLTATDPKQENRKWPQLISMVGNTKSEIELVEDSQFSVNNCIFKYPNVPYGDIRATPQIIKNISENLDYHISADRSYLWLLMREQFINGLVPHEQYLGLLKKSIEQEQDPLIVNLLLNNVQEAFGNFSGTTMSKVESIENLFWNSLMNKQESLKKYFFNSYVAITQSKDSQQNLLEILSNESIIPVPISQRDRIRIVYRLALLNNPDWSEHLQLEKEKITNPDYAEQVQFTSQFLTDDKDKLDSLFLLFKDSNNREREPWILEAMRLLNHSTRKDHAIKYIRPSLDWLEDIQKTGDIFFPKRWLDALFSGHNSIEAVELVTEFLDDRPQYPITLKNKILQSVDLVKRAAQ